MMSIRRLGLLALRLFGVKTVATAPQVLAPPPSPFRSPCSTRVADSLHQTSSCDVPMNENRNGCTCQPGGGWCEKRGRWVTKVGQIVCASAHPEDSEVYFGVNKENAPRTLAHPITRTSPCEYMGARLTNDDGTFRRKTCGSCAGHVEIKEVFACHHPRHFTDPTTTARECSYCGDYRASNEPALVQIGATLA